MKAAARSGARRIVSRVQVVAWCVALAGLVSAAASRADSAGVRSIHGLAAGDAPSAERGLGDVDPTGAAGATGGGLGVEIAGEASAAGEEPAAAVAAGAFPAPTLQVSSVPVGLFPDIAVMSPDERFGYITSYQEETVLVLDLQALRVVRRIRVPDEIWGLAISADGRRLYVATTPFPAPHTTQCQGIRIGGLVPSRLLIIDAFKGTVLKSLSLPGQALNLLLSPDGSHLAAVTDRSVELFDLASERLVESIPSPAQDAIDEAAFSAGGTKIFAASLTQGVTVFDLPSHSAHTLAPSPTGYGFIGLGMTAVAADDSVFTSLIAGDNLALAVIDAATEQVRQVVPAADLGAMGGVLFSSLRSELFLPASDLVLDAARFTVAGRTPGNDGFLRTGVIGRLSPDQAWLYARPVGSYPDSISLYTKPVHYDLVVVDTASLQEVLRVVLGKQAITCTAIAPLVIGASGRVLIAPNPALRTVSVIKVCASPGGC
jgi:hypothetical protein